MAEQLKHHEPLNITIYFKNPSTGVRSSKTVRYLQTTTFREVLGDAYKSFEVESIAPIEHCSLLGYDSNRDEVCNSFYAKETAIGLIWRGTDHSFANTSELLLDIFKETSEEPKEEEVKEHRKLHIEDFSWYSSLFTIQAFKETTVKNVKKQISELYAGFYEPSKMHLALLNTAVEGNKPEILQDDAVLDTESISNDDYIRIFATTELEEEEFKKEIEEVENHNIWRSYAFLTVRGLSPDSVPFPLRFSEVKITRLPNCKIVCSNETYDETKFFFKFLLYYFHDQNSDGNGINNDLRIKITVDLRMTVNEFFNNLQECIEIPVRTVFQYSDLSLDESLTLMQIKENDMNILEDITGNIKDFVNYGRSLTKDKVESLICYSDIEDENVFPEYICNYVIKKSAEVGQTKRKILEHIRGLDDKYANLSFERTRLRLEKYDEPARILPDDTKFSDVPPVHEDDDDLKIDRCRKIIIQKVSSEVARLFDSAGQPISIVNRTFLVRRFYPSELKLSNWEELVAGKDTTVSQMKSFLSKFSEIPENNIKYVIISKEDLDDYEFSMRFINELIENDSLKTEGELNFDLLKIIYKDSWQLQYWQPNRLSEHEYGIIFKDSTENLPENRLEEKSSQAFRRPFSAGR